MVGESGCGKSTLALAAMGLLRWKRGTAAGRLLFRGRDLLGMREPELRSLRGREIALVLQSPVTALNPALRIERQLWEAWRIHSTDGKDAGRARFRELFARVELPVDDAFLRRYPNEISIGQAQRVLIAMAILHKPAVLIADEPTSALDAVVAAEVLTLFRELAEEQNMALLLISHDLLSVARTCENVAIMRDGEIVERGEVRRVLESPEHAYTRRLVGALPGRLEW